VARELSSRNTKNRLRRRMNMDVIRRDVEMIKPLEEWDWEELQRGYPKGENGKFNKRPIWADLFRCDDEVQRRLRNLTAANLKAHASEAVEVLVGLMKEDGTDLDGRPIVPPNVRLKAAELVLDHTIGKPTAHVQFDAGDNLTSLLASCMVNDDGDDAHPVIMGQVIEDDEEGDL